MANILVIGPHPDDQELGMGGTIALLAEQGHDVLLLDMTNGEPTPFGDPVTRAREAEAARAILSADPARFPDARPLRRALLGLPNRRVEHSLESRHLVAGAIRAHRADVLFLPYFEDAHPDHIATTRIAEDARFDAKLTSLDLPTPDGLEPGPPIYPRWLFYYYCTHLRHVANPGFLIDITGHLDRKIDAINAYHTQFVLPEKNRRVVEWVRQQAGYLGSRIGVESAEGFFTREPIGLTGLSGIVGL